MNITIRERKSRLIHTIENLDVSVQLQQEKNNQQAGANIANDILDEIENLPKYLSLVKMQHVYDYEGVRFFSQIVNKRKSYKIMFFLANEFLNITTIWDCRRNPKIY